MRVVLLDPRPLRAGFELDRGLHHAERRRVGGGLGPARLAEDAQHLREALQDPVLGGQQLAGLGHRDPGAGDRHVEDGPLVERRHELAADPQRQDDGERDQEEVDEQGGFLEAQGPADHRLVDPAQEARDRVFGLRLEAFAFQEERHQHRHQGDREDGGGRHGEGLGEGERPEQPPLLGLEHEDRHERDDDDHQGEEDPPAHLLAGFDDGGGAVSTLLLGALGQAPVGVFHHHDRGVHQHADRKRDAAEGHDVGGDAQGEHRDEGDQHRDGKREDRHEGRAEVEQEDDHHQADHDDLLDQRALQVFDGGPDQLRAVVGRDDPDALRQPGGDLADLLLDGADDAQGVFAEAHDHDAAGHLAAAVELDDAAADVGAEDHLGDVAHQHRRAGLAADHDALDVRDGLDVAPAAHHVLAAAELEQPPLDVVVGHPDALHHVADGDAVGREAVGVDVDLVLLDEAADAGHLGHARDAGERVADVPVLQRPQVGEVVRAALVDQRVGEHPADAGGVGAEDRGGALGELAADLLQVLEHPGARPVDVGPVLEDRVDVGEAEVRKPAHGFDPGGGDEGGDDRVGDLVLDQIRAASLPGRVDDHLHVGDVRHRVERDVLERIHPAPAPGAPRP